MGGATPPPHLLCESVSSVGPWICRICRRKPPMPLGTGGLRFHGGNCGPQISPKELRPSDFTEMTDGGCHPTTPPSVGICVICGPVDLQNLQEKAPDAVGHRGPQISRRELRSTDFTERTAAHRFHRNN